MRAGWRSLPSRLPALLLPLVLALLALKASVCHANYIVGLANTTWINITYVNPSAIGGSGNLTGYLGDWLSSDGIVTVTLTGIVGSDQGAYHYWEGEIRLHILRLNGTYDVWAEIVTTGDTGTGATEVDPAKVYATIVPVWADTKTSPFLNNLTTINITLPFTPGFENKTMNWYGNTNVKIWDSITQQAYDNTSVPRFEESDISFYADNETSTSTPPTPWVCYWVKDNVTLGVDNAVIPESQWLEGKRVVFYPESYSDWEIRCYWADGSGGTVYYPRIYGTFGELVQTRKISYPPPPIAYVTFILQEPTRVKVYALANGLLASEYDGNSTTIVFPASSGALYICEPEGAGSFSFQAQNGASYTISTKPIVLIPSNWTAEEENKSNLWLPENRMPDLPFSPDPALWILSAYIIAAVLMAVLPRQIAWLGFAMASGVIVFLHSKGVLTGISDTQFYAAVFTPIVLSVIVCGLGVRR